MQPASTAMSAHRRAHENNRVEDTKGADAPTRRQDTAQKETTQKETAQIVAGVDEVGRGPLAGPVVAAAVVLPMGFDAHALADSKTLSPARRMTLAAQILAVCPVGIASLSAPEIDARNIHAASLEAMRRAIHALPVLPDLALVDGKFVPPGLPCAGRAVIGGDAKVKAIAAASIVAKVWRDAMMLEADKQYPGYGFARHAGYPTALHRAALMRLGLCALHRHSFGPCRALAEGT